MFCFCIPLTRRKTSDFLTFSESVEVEHCCKNGLIRQIFQLVTIVLTGFINSLNAKVAIIETSQLIWRANQLIIIYIMATLAFNVLRLKGIDMWSRKTRHFLEAVYLHLKFHPGMKSSLSMVKCLLLFTRFCRDEISSRDERQGWDFIPGWKKEKKTCKHFILG